MQNYELVILLDPKTQENERNELLSKFEEEFKGSIVEKDDLWVQQLQYDLWRVRNRNSAHIVSYYLTLETSKIDDVKKMFLYNNIIFRYSILKMSKEQQKWNFDKLQKELTKIIEGWDVRRFGNRISFFSLSENGKYINWKSVVMLKKYLTRFGNMKPRKYTKNTVSIQKKLRKEIIKAREFGLLEYTK